MNFDDLKDWPFFHTRVKCADGKFGTLHAVDEERGEAVVCVLNERACRYIPASELEPDEFDLLVQERSAD